ncbi:MAG: serine/threonine-protein phosphatase [Coriobacteriales bacterium]|jgi:protein phosphatase|nr:serine/threonine-protein phosphatase [Coriobacteriales bacterium]
MGQNGREEQEGQGDRPEAFAVLCDGMGGTELGAEASGLVVEEAAVALDALGADDDVVACLYGLVQQLDCDVCDQFGAGRAGTTVVAVYLRDNRMNWLSVGDSRIYLIREDGIECLTRDHNLQMALDNEVARKSITVEEMESFARRDSLISFIGQGGLPLIDHSPEPLVLGSGDVVLLCSDGLTKSLGDDQIAAIIRECPDNLDETARRLVIEAFDTGGEKDNTTVALLRYLEDQG